MADESKLSRKLEEASLLREGIEKLLANTKKRGVDNFTEPYLKNRLRSLNEIWDRANKFNTEIQLAVPHKDRSSLPYFSDEVFESIEEKFEEAEAYLTSHINQIHVSILEQTQQTSSPLEKHFQSSNERTLDSNVVKLPTLELPKFAGDYVQWPLFRDSFSAAVHNNRQLSGVQKFQYLLASLQGQARDVISAFAMNNENYSIAWSALKTRFENKRLIISSLLNRLVSLKSVSLSRLSELMHMRTEIFSVLESLNNVGVDTSSWAPLVIHMAIQHFDFALRRKWEEFSSGTDGYPTLDRFQTFLNQRIQPLEAMNMSSLKTNTRPTQSGNRLASHIASEPSSNCFICSQQHTVYVCPEFSKLSVSQRHQKIRELKRCWNCLSSGHGVQQCRSPRRCRLCGQPHHSLLHLDKSNSHISSVEDESEDQEPPCSNQFDSMDNESQSNHPETIQSHLGTFQANSVFLATARVIVSSPEGRSMECRALIDQGSQSSFISESVAQFLHLRRVRTSFVVSGVGNSSHNKVKAQASVCVSSLIENQPKLDVQAFILQSITSYRPPRAMSLPADFVQGLRLADPRPLSQDRIDILLGADVYGLLMCDGMRKSPDSSLIAQHSIFGWILSGHAPGPSLNQVFLHHCTNDDLSEQLRAFWELEAVPKPQFESVEHAQCEQLFRETTTRDPSGRFIVRLPFESPEACNKLGDSLKRATFLYRKLESRLTANAKLREAYEDFMSEYIELNHMSVSERAKLNPHECVFLPHHGILREDKLTTKLRAVFNASSPTSTGVSLNDILLTGPKLQTEIASVLANWRSSRYAIVGDMVKMFRQILVHPDDRRFQCILWRLPQSREIVPFELNTVTYGTGPAPFLANRVIRELAALAEKEQPLASAVLRKKVYVDDLVFGADDLPLLQTTKDQVSIVLQSGGFQVKKWVANTPDILSPIEEQEMLTLTGGSPVMKVLGLPWNHQTDSFELKPSSMKSKVGTKREIASLVMSCFDPLGLLSPLIILPKCFLQSLWLLKLDWPDFVPPSVLEQWKEIDVGFSGIDKFVIPRWVQTGTHSARTSLVGFSDASFKAFGAAVYVRVEDISGQISSLVLMAKSRVAPLKTVSIPRLELCGASLLKELIVHVLSAVDVAFDDIHCFTDSKIVLAWLNRQPFHWATFVGNRVSEIQSALPQVLWHHVPSKENPADLISRGMTATELSDSVLWWKGPSWLYSTAFDEKIEDSSQLSTNEELRARASHLVSLHLCKPEAWDLLRRYSSWFKLLRVCSYIRRFVSCLCRDESVRRLTSLGTREIEDTRIFILSLLQHLMFSSELVSLHSGSNVSSKSKLLSLDPKLDENGLIRVGGRLSASDLPVGSKHPVILLADPLIENLVRDYHLRTLHGGLQLTLQALREEYWIVGARNFVKRVINTCTVCIRYRAQLAFQKMSDLPAERCTPSRPFSSTGMDYAGPFDIRLSSGRGSKSSKGWIAVFVCLATKAIHIEVVSDYSSKSFLAAFDRMTARRGLPAVVFSDNGTTFQGADRELQKVVTSVSQDADFVNLCAVRGVSWKFIPPSAPHFGGLWEAGVKSLKYHLRRSLRNHTPTFEELSTITCRIEACLNSRPLTPLHDEIDSLEVLTPGHFLTGSPILSSPTTATLAQSSYARWRVWSQLIDQIWKAWRNDYLHSLQSRHKWPISNPNFQVGDLVLMRTPVGPPGSWPLARILELLPGKDSLVRVVRLKTSNSTFTRPITQLCLLYRPS